jgi:hypothetical protein
MPNNSAQFSLESMDASEAWKYERDWKTLRRKPLGEILQMKFHGRLQYDKELAEMELKRRTFVRDKLFDRILSTCAIVISIIALVLTYLSHLSR